jgi:hypothetical protein
LAAKRREVDLAALARILGQPGSHESSLRARLSTMVRGAPPEDDDLDRRIAAVRRQLASLGVDDATVAELLGPLLHQLRDGSAAALRVVEVDAVGVTRYLLEPGPDRALQLPRTQIWTWEELLPWLPAEPDARLFRLAGGVGTSRGSPARAGRIPDEADLGPVLASISVASSRDPVLLLRRVAGWPVVDRATALVAEQIGFADMPPGSFSPDGGTAAVSQYDSAVPDAVATLPAPAPSAPATTAVPETLAEAYALALAEVSPRDRQVRLVAHELFPAGTPVEPAGVTAEVPVELPGSTPADGVLLALVRGTTAPPATWVPVAAARLPRPVAGRARVEVVLTAPDQAHFAAPPNALQSTVDWSALVDGLPGSYGVAPVDLTVLVELGGLTAAPALARLELVRDLLELLRTEHPDPMSLRIGVVGYDDHVIDARGPRGSVVHAGSLSSLDGAVAALAGLRPSKRQLFTAAPIEDALLAVVGSDWRRDATQVVATVGSLPPHPPGAAADCRVPRCPLKHDWRTTMKELRGTRDTRFVAIQGEAERPLRGGGRAWPELADQAWAALGADGRREQAPTDARELALLAGAMPARTALLELPLAVVRPCRPGSWDGQVGSP